MARFKKQNSPPSGEETQIPSEGQSEQSEVPDLPWTIYVPPLSTNDSFDPAQPGYEQQHRVGLPYNRDVSPGDPLLVVMSCPSHLQAARLFHESGSEIVVWAWLCSEVLARQAETEFPVVYGIPTPEEVNEAAAAGVQEQPNTSLCLALESAFNIPEQL